VPRHGPILAYVDLADYVLMLKTVRDRISKMIHDGMSLEQVITAKPTAEFDEKYRAGGGPSILIDRAYMSLSR